MSLSLRNALAPLALVFPLAACSPTLDAPRSERRSTVGEAAKPPVEALPQPSPAPAPENQPTPETPEPPSSQLSPGTNAYDPASGKFVVHEWGTLTSVVASDGHLL